MGSLRFADIQTRPTEVLDLTRLTLDEFQRLVPPFEGTFQAPMARWRLDGQPRTARRYTTDKNSPLPTPEDRLLLILVYLKTYPLPVGHGRLFGMGQSKAHQWIYVLLAVLQTTLRLLGDAPSRSLAELAHRLGVAEAEATALVVPTTEPPTPAELPEPTPACPLLAMMAPNGASSAPKTRLSRRAVIAARQSATR
jgi:Helix-turn-helix of DDE superfamily endonuclease